MDLFILYLKNYIIPLLLITIANYTIHYIEKEAKTTIPAVIDFSNQFQ